MATTTADLLPTFPRIFFLYLEPFIMSYGIFIHYMASQDLILRGSSFPLPTLLLGPLAQKYLLAEMLYGLIILLASPPNKKLLQLHILILCLADFTHWTGMAYTIAHSDPRGFAAVLDTSSWDAETWKLVLFPLGTLSIKFATLGGWFGKIRG